MYYGTENNSGAEGTTLEMNRPGPPDLYPSLLVSKYGPSWAMWVEGLVSGIYSWGKYEYGVWGRGIRAGVAADTPVRVAVDLTRSDFPPGVWGAGPVGVYGVVPAVGDQPVRQGAAGVVGRGEARGSHGVVGEAIVLGGVGVMGINQNQGGTAGIFQGNVIIDKNLYVTGDITKGGGGFKIDHPLDPENKYLSHSYVESPNALNIYSGNATTDVDGNATVPLPEYFEALNEDFRYQLTVIGDLAHAVVAEEISDNQFKIKSDRPNVKVSWQVTGARKDALAKLNPMPVEEEKPSEERGTYLHPEAFEQPESRGVDYASREALAEALRVGPEIAVPEEPEAPGGPT